MDFCGDGEPTFDVASLLTSQEVGANSSKIVVSSGKQPSVEATATTPNKIIQIEGKKRLKIALGEVDFRREDEIGNDENNEIKISIAYLLGGWGSGEHATTQICCRKMLNTSQLFANQKVLDFGCGSGILSILAAKLGSSKVVGVDIEPSAVTQSAKNAELNSLYAPKCHFYLPPGSYLDKNLDFFCRFGDWKTFTDQTLPAEARDFDIVIANILPGPLVGLAPLLCSLLRPPSASNGGEEKGSSAVLDHGGNSSASGNTDVDESDKGSAPDRGDNHGVSSAPGRGFAGRSGIGGGVMWLAGMRRFQAAMVQAAYAECGVALAVADTLVDGNGEEWVLLGGGRA